MVETYAPNGTWEKVYAPPRSFELRGAPVSGDPIVAVASGTMALYCR
jgi:hypothetical protein